MPSKSLVELERPGPLPAALTDYVYSALKQQILTCMLAPGADLNEKVLCDELKVSRTPLREALNRLANERLVLLAPRRGYAVVSITVQDILELTEVRRGLESECAALAAERATAQDIARLEELAELCYEPGDRTTYVTYLRANSEFHLALVRCSRNLRLETLVMNVLDQLQRPMYLGLDFGFESADATAEHLDIIEAVRAHDAERAREVMRRNFANTQEHILAAMKAAGYVDQR